MLYQLSYAGKIEARIVPQAGTRRTPENRPPLASRAAAYTHDDVDTRLLGARR
jgi:hypothetical protein